MTPDYEGRDSLSPRERAVMDHLHLHGPSTSTEIREATGLDRHAVHQAVRSLTRFGFIVALTESRSNIPAILAPSPADTVPGRLRHPLTDIEREVLDILVGCEVTARDIATRRHRTVTPVRNTLISLETRGLAGSRVVLEQGRRKRVWSATDEGRRALEGSE